MSNFSIPTANEPVAGNLLKSRLIFLKLPFPGARKCEPCHISTFVAAYVTLCAIRVDAETGFLHAGTDCPRAGYAYGTLRLQLSSTIS